MAYQQFKGMSFFKKINTEEKARKLIWSAKFAGKDFVCSSCHCETFYQLVSQPEIRQCKSCRHHERLRVNTMFSNSKLPILTWIRAIYLAMQGKRGLSALELQGRLGIGSYRTAWRMLRKIRRALQCRDERYKLKEIIELDASGFGKRATGNQRSVFVAIESKDWVDEKGKPKSKAGFAKIMVAPETQVNAQVLIDGTIEKGSMINTDAKFKNLKNVDHDYREMLNNPEKINAWLPWVHKFISNAKRWVLGTHHGAIRAKYLNLYLSEYTYRFNRRHDPDGLFHRALTSCVDLEQNVYGRLCA